MNNAIYFADLTHTANGFNAPTFPLGTSFVLSYAKKLFGSDFNFQLFKFPETLAKAIIDRPPLVLALSNYSWNLNLGYKLNHLAKKINPELVSIFGGPNFPILPEEKTRFLKQYPDIDFYLEFEGEIGFAALLQTLQKHDFDVTAIKECEEPINNCSYLIGEKLVTGPFKQINELDTIPSPYLTGLLDEFFDFPLAPMIETTRGCPFSCSFCADGLKIKSKIRHFSSQRTREELIYIGERVRNIDELIITDLNFGMYNEDVLTAQYIAELQEDKHWPVLIGASAGKNNPERIIRTAAYLKDSWLIGFAIQSADPEVLKNIKRNNISLDTYQQLLDFSNKMGNDALTYTEIILGLPGDTKEKHFNSLRYGIENNVNSVRMYQSILLYGTDMATQHTREKFQLQTKFRIIPGSIGTYNFGEEMVTAAEIEEIIVGSKDMPFDDYISCRVMNLLIETYINNASFEELFVFLNGMGIPAFDCLIYLYEHEELYTPEIKKILDDFVFMTKDDLYNTYEEAEQYVLQPEIAQRYIKEELGINELLVCKARLYLAFEGISQMLFESARSLLRAKDMLSSNIERFLDQLEHFLICRKKDFHKYDQILTKSFDYDFQALFKNGYEFKPGSVNESSSSISLRFYHTPEQKDHISNSLKLYAETSAGFGRMIQRTNLKKMYRQFELS